MCFAALEDCEGRKEGAFSGTLALFLCRWRYVSPHGNKSAITGPRTGRISSAALSAGRLCGR